MTALTTFFPLGGFVAALCRPVSLTWADTRLFFTRLAGTAQSLLIFSPRIAQGRFGLPARTAGLLYSSLLASASGRFV